MSTRHRGAAIVFWLSVYFLYVTFLRDPRGIVVLLIHLALLPVVFPLWIFASQEWQDASLEVLWARLHICEEIAPSPGLDRRFQELRA